MNWKTLFKSFKSSDMRRRVFAVLGLIAVYRFLAHVPVPLAEPTQLKSAIGQMINQNSVSGFLNLMSGGALTNISIMLVGLNPYILASVIIQLLTKAIPRMNELSEDGEQGRKKLNQLMRVISLPLAVLQSIAYIFILRSSLLSGTSVIGELSSRQWVMSVVAMSAGAMLAMWLGEIITEKGIGNGMTLLIIIGILSQVPRVIGVIWTAITTENGDPFHVLDWFTIKGINNSATWAAIGLIAALIAIIYLLVKINEAERIITINYAKRVRGNSQYGGVRSIIPIKLISAGVIPVIFAVSALAVPAFVGQLMIATGWHADVGQNLVLWFQRGSNSITYLSGWQSLIYPVCYFLLVVFFTYFYTSIVFDSREIAESLQQQGGFIENIRPGKQTEEYLRGVVNRLTLFGSLALGLISIMPFIGESILQAQGLSTVASSLSISGTGMLIIVTGALECLRQMNSRALMVSYDEFK